MAVSKVVLGDETLIDLTGDSVSSENLLQGETAHGANGEEIIGGVVVTPMYTGTKAAIEEAIALGQIPEDAVVNITDDEEASSFQAQINEINSSLKWYIDNGYLPDPSNVALVPIMTSNTTPYGEVITNSQYTNKYDAYKAFNDTISEPERWLSTNTTGQYIAYKFDKKANVKSLYLNCNNVYCEGQLFGAFKLQASNDGYTWSDIYSDDLSAYGEKNYSFGNENYYSYYRVLSTSSEAQYRSLSRVQFYGKFAS